MPYFATLNRKIGQIQKSYLHKVSDRPEEAPVAIDSWFYQRSRWIKGFLQTFIIFLNCSTKTDTLTKLQIIVTYIFIGVSTYNFFCLPWLILMIIKNTNPIINYLWFINSFFAFSYSYATAFYTVRHYKRTSTVRHLQLFDYLVIIIYPFYSILHSIASHKAMFEIVVHPFKWNKTPHGVSASTAKDTN